VARPDRTDGSRLGACCQGAYVMFLAGVGRRRGGPVDIAVNAGSESKLSDLLVFYGPDEPFVRSLDRITANPGTQTLAGAGLQTQPGEAVKLAVPWQSRFSRGLKLASTSFPVTLSAATLAVSLACSPRCPPTGANEPPKLPFLIVIWG
jgi:hypothetical protein